VATEAHKAIVRRFFEQAVNRRQYDVIDELVASDLFSEARRAFGIRLER
jgi:hypothetical protein